MKIFFVVFLIYSFTTFGQNQDDVNEYKRYSELFNLYEFDDSLKARIYSDSCLYFALKTNNDEIIGRAYQTKGWFFEDLSMFLESKNLFFKARSYFVKAKNTQGVANANGNIGNAFVDLRDYENALKYHLISLDVNQQIIDKSKEESQEYIDAHDGLTIALHNISSVYSNIYLYDLALIFEQRSLTRELKSGNQGDVGISYAGLGRIFSKLEMKDSAQFYFRKAINIFEDEKLDYNLSSSLSSFANMINNDLSVVQRVEMLEKAYLIRKGIGDVEAEVKILLSIVELNFNEFENDSLVKIFRFSDRVILENNFIKPRIDLVELKSRYFYRIKQYDSAYFYLNQSLELINVFEDNEKKKELGVREVQKLSKEKMVKDSLVFENQIQMERFEHQVQLDKKQNSIYLSVLGGGFILLILIFILSVNKKRKKMNAFLAEKNKLIQKQKSIVELKNQSISDSINYAQRLQNAILPKKSDIKTFLPDSFVLSLPKDVVSGDFYWFFQVDTKIMIASADCTGHGVPGALVSVVCSNALNRAVKEYSIIKPAEILNKAREIVIETFSQSGQNIYDGMDISLCVIDLQTKILEFSGANNPVWIIRNSKEELTELPINMEGEFNKLYEIKGDKQPVAFYEKIKEFSTSEVQLNSGDELFLFSDGFVDQFGGPKNKKYKSKAFKNFLLRNSILSMNDLEKSIYKEFIDWKGNNEQIDDVCVVGFRLQ